MTVATDNTACLTTLETLRSVRGELPDVHLTLGLSNISFGLPARSQLNRTFLTLAMGSGLDSAILDPLNQQTMATVMATEAVLGRDPHCLGYLRASRRGLFEPASGQPAAPTSQDQGAK